jgi:hypothetical protein
MWGSIWIPINGVPTPFILDISHAEMNWGINSIPTATVLLSTGFNSKDGLPATIHYLVNYLKMQLPFALILQVTPLTNSLGIPPYVWPDTWPNTPFSVFEGYTAAIGFSTSMSGQATYTLTIDHWLSDLNYSSALTASTNTLSASRLARSANIFFNTPVGVAAGGAGANFVSATGGLAYFSTGRIATDFWGLSLKPWLQGLCRQDVLTDPSTIAAGGAIAGGENSQALKALARFEPFANTGYTWGVPLPFGIDITQQATALNILFQSINEDAVQGSITSWYSQTLWEKLGTYAANYLFSVVPMVKRCLVVPMQPGIQGVWQTIYTEEYDQISFGGLLPRLIRGVRILGGLGNDFGANGGVQPQNGANAAQTSVGGTFNNPNLTAGMLLYLDAPKWLSCITSPNALGRAALAPNGVCGNALFPGSGVTFNGFTAVARRQAGQGVLTNYAQSMYVNEILQGRTGRLTGKLRFDISPGSSVRVAINEEAFIAAKLPAVVGDNYMYGTVRRLTHVIDAEQTSASTTFDIGWLRSEAENALPGTSIAAHPIWANQWYGAPNVDLPQFIPNTLGPNPLS